MQDMQQNMQNNMQNMQNMQVLMILLNIACNMQNMQNNMHDRQNMQTSFPICRTCTAHFADGRGPGPDGLGCNPRRVERESLAMNWIVQMM
jgi:hypothetical protein